MEIKKFTHPVFVVLTAVLIINFNVSKIKSQIRPVDKKATAQTVALYKNLKKMSGKKILFGQQDVTAYGVDRNDPVKEFCDIKDVTGQYPALYGWDIGHIKDSCNVDGVPFNKIERLIKEAYSRGGVISISWHENNPAGTGAVNDLTPAVKRILPGGDKHKEFTNLLNLVGQFFLKLKDKDGKPIPIIFRPYHEHNGDWFWWGKNNCTEQEYAALFRFTVEYLRDTLNVHQLLYAISPDRSRMNPATFEKDILYAYPGDDYIDILGIDNYWDVGRSSEYEKNKSQATLDSLFISSLKALVKIAGQKNKIAALTETGNNGLKAQDWFTKRILSPIKNDPQARKIAWILIWRNASKEHFYAPYPGHQSSQDFINFMNDEMILFENKLPKMYK